MAAVAAQGDGPGGTTVPVAGRRALVIEHDPYTRPGWVGAALTRCGLSVERRLVVPEDRFEAPDVEHAFPDPGDYDVVVPMGAPWSVDDEARIGPWVGGELAMLRAAHERGVPVLGVCFGAQALSVALGGTVRRGDGWELGWGAVETDDPDAVPAGPWFQFHQDVMTVPPGAVELARTAFGPQAWRLGRSLAVQFHPEVTSEVLDLWLDHGGAQVVRAQGLDVAALRRRTAAESASGGAAARADRLVRSFLDDVARSTGRTDGDVA